MSQQIDRSQAGSKASHLRQSMESALLAGGKKTIVSDRDGSSFRLDNVDDMMRVHDQ